MTVRSALVAVLVGGVAASGSAAPAPAGGPGTKLIYCGWHGNTIPTPSFIRSNWQFLDTQPFDGLAVYLRTPDLSVNVSTGIMSARAYSYDTIMSVMQPMRGLGFQNLTHNMPVIYGSTPPDFFDSWTTTVQNWRNLARAIRDSGMKGIVFDNEQYFSPWGNYPSGVKYQARTLQEYYDQARVRGREVMQAMVAEFPDIAVITLHGPTVSEPKAPTSLGFPVWYTANELLGPFFAGFAEGSGPQTVNCDGGELYQLRTIPQFQGTYDWRKYTIASNTVDCKFIPPTLRPTWPSRCSISFGVYDRPFGGASMDPAICRTTIGNAMKVADQYVWFYTEANTFLLPSSQGGASSTWVNAVRQGRLDAIGSAPAPTPTVPVAPASLVASAVSQTEVSLSWQDRSSDETGFQIQRRPAAGTTWSQIATPNANVTTYRDATATAGTAYVYRVRAVNAAGSSAWSNEASATTPAAVQIPEVSSFTLINADTDQPISGHDPMANGVQLDLAALPTRNLSIRANTSPATVGSVRFTYDGNPDFRMENGSPYALAGDSAAEGYLPWTPTVGLHVLIATPYTGADGGGSPGAGRTIGFTISDGATPAFGNGSTPACGLVGWELALLALLAAGRRARRTRA